MHKIMDALSSLGIFSSLIQCFLIVCYTDAQKYSWINLHILKDSGMACVFLFLQFKF